MFSLVVVVRSRILRDLLTARFQGGRHFRVLAAGTQPREAVALCQQHQPDVLLLKHPLNISTAEIMAQLRKQEKPVPVVIYAPRPADACGMMQVGAAACVTGEDSLELLEDALRIVAGGGRYFSPNSVRYEQAQAELTFQQREILRLLTCGCTTKDVAQHLGLSVKTADHYRTRLMQKLKAHSVAELIRYAVCHGIVELS